jgi:hypothetical protein
MSDDPPNKRKNEETFIIPKNMFNPVDMIYNRFMQHHKPFGFQTSDSEIVFHPMPYAPEGEDNLLLKQPWQIILELYQEDHRMALGLDLYGDVILGRGTSQPGRIILDMEPYGAHTLGVSREHCLLRPTANKLFAIDQGSTNQTTINGAPSGRGVATQLQHQDMINLGSMVMMLHILSRPDTAL